MIYNKITVYTNIYNMYGGLVMSDYIISCCSTADLTEEHFNKRDIHYICFHYELDGAAYMDDLGKTINLDAFYKAMSEGADTKTSQINVDEYETYFEEFLKEGKDILIIAAGQLVSEALDCAEELEKEGYSVEVIDMFTIKPLDEKLLIKEAKGKSKIVTIENHSIYGGLGSAVSEVIAENGISVPVKRIGVKEKFGQVGTAEFLQEEFGLTAKQIKETICQF